MSSANATAGQGDAEHDPEVWVKPCSLPQGGTFEVILKTGLPPEYTSAYLWIYRIDDDQDTPVMGLGAAASAATDSRGFSCKLTRDLIPGLYRIASFEVGVPSNENPASRLALTQQQLALCIFEVRDALASPRSGSEIRRRHREILELRNRSFLAGLGRDPQLGTWCEYLVLFFVKDCLVTQPLRLGQYEVIPLGSLPRAGEVEMVLQFLGKFGLAKEVAEASFPRREGNEPVAVFHFPRVLAASQQEAFNVVRQEVEDCLRALCLLRSSYGATFACYIMERLSGRYSLDLVPKTYAGNIMGGLLSGEDPRRIVATVAKVRRSDALRLFLDLYAQALREPRGDFAVFRFWNLLETIARSKGYVGQPMCDWQGAQLRNRKGRLRTIQDESEAIVTEHIRRSHKILSLAPSFLVNGVRISRIELVPVWYRRRNCVAHRGKCGFGEPRMCLNQDPKYVACHEAHKRLNAPGQLFRSPADRVLEELRAVAELVMQAEVRES